MSVYYHQGSPTFFITMSIANLTLFRIIAIILSICSCTCVFGQGQIKRHSKSNSYNKSSKQIQTIHSEKQDQSNLDSISNLPREEEHINSILVRWHPDVTIEQKVAITTIINNLIDIEGGTFIMGSDKHDHYWEYAGKRYYMDEPSHSEKAKSFKLSKYEITQKIWEAIMGNNPSRYWGDDFPVTNVSWNDCQSFINKIKQLSDVEFRLPTEVEWDYVARKNLPHGSEYTEYIKKTEWVSVGSDKMPHSVGTKECNSFGVYDIIGNVREWTSDHASLDYNHTRNLSTYNARGNTYNSWSPEYMRFDFSPSDKKDTLGFRLAL